MLDTIKMNPEVKAAWLEALRSGEYAQGHGKLCRPAGYEGQTEDTFCCLGVLTDVAIKAGKGELTADRETHAYGVTYRDSDGFGVDNYLPESVRIWAGLESSNPRVNYRDAAFDQIDTLSNLNDGGSFDLARIADIIDANF